MVSTTGVSTAGVSTTTLSSTGTVAGAAASVFGAGVGFGPR